MDTFTCFMQEVRHVQNKNEIYIYKETCTTSQEYSVKDMKNYLWNQLNRILTHIKGP